MGRPSEYTVDVGLAICVALSDGLSLRSICAAEGMPDRATVYRWLAANESFRDQYARAREDQADTLADEIVAIADEEQDPARARVRVDARKWVASKLKPKKYSERVDLTHASPTGGPVETKNETIVNFISPASNG